MAGLDYSVNGKKPKLIDGSDPSGLRMILDPNGSVKKTARAIGDTQPVQNLANSPAAGAAKFAGKNAIAGALAVPAAFMDVVNKGANAVNAFLGGDANYFSTNNTGKALSIANTPPQSAATLTQTQTPQLAASHAPAMQMPALASSREAAQPITTPDQVQRPAAQRVSGLSSQKPVAIAGPAVPQGDTLKPGEQGGIIEITDTNDPKYRKVVRLPGVQQSQSVAGEQQVGSAAQIGSTEYFLNQVDPTVRSLAPMRAMRIAGERADKLAATQLAKQEAEQKALLTGAQTDYYKAHADLYKAQSSPEYLNMQEGIVKSKQHSDAVKDRFNHIKDMVMPAGFEGKHMEVAKILTAADDPESDVGVYYTPGQQRQGIATKRSIFDPLLNKYRKAGYPEVDAHGQALRELKELERRNGKQLSRPLPYLENLYNRPTKQPDFLGLG